MSDNIQIINGKAQFASLRVPAWHKLGSVVDTTAEMRSEVERILNFEVDKLPVRNPVTGHETNFFALVRDDTFDVLDIVSDSYVVSQPADMLNFMINACGEEKIQFETVGVLGKGEQIFATAKYNEFEIMASGDMHKSYLLGLNSYNKSKAETYKSVVTRVVCANTIAMALSENGAKITLAHRGESRAKRANYLNIFKIARENNEHFQKTLEVLSQKAVTSEMVAESIAQIFKIEVGDKLSTNKANQILTVKDLFESNDNNAFPEFRGTAYNLFNAVTEFTDHFRGGDDEKRAKSAMFGSGDSMKNSALEIIMEVCANGASVNQPVAYSYTDNTGKKSSILDDILDAAVL